MKNFCGTFFKQTNFLNASKISSDEENMTKLTQKDG